MIQPRVLAADIGRTTCRLAVRRLDGHGRPLRAEDAKVEVPSGASLADPDGVAVVLDAITAAARDLPDAAEGSNAIVAVAVGASGAAQQPGAAAELADALGHRYPNAIVRVTSDVVVAHLGALGGHPGVLAVAGTGAVALGVARDGSHRLVDGWGHLLGDAGSGVSIGRAGLEAALRHHDGRSGGSAALAQAAGRRYGPLDLLAATIHGTPAAVRAIASFVPDVAAAARDGDHVAADILREAVAALADTIGAAVEHVVAHDEPGTPVEVAVTGGLTHLDDLVLTPLVRVVTSTHPSVSFLPAAQDGLSGSLRLATERTGVHDPLIVQAAPRRAAPVARDGPAPATTRSEER